ncbi:MAG: nucleotidyltransferase domain-containing protein [bacterium]
MVLDKTGLTKPQLNLLFDIFKQYPAIDQVTLYGSRAKGTYHERSDIDLVAHGSLLNRDIIAATLLDLDDSDIPYQVDLQSYHDLNNQKLIDHINRIGLTIYQKETIRHD